MLTLKPGKSFFIPEKGEGYGSAYLRIGDVSYDFDNKAVRIELKFYESKEAYENQQPTLTRRQQVVNESDLEKWFNLTKINTNRNLLTLISGYLSYLQSGGQFTSGYIRAGEFVYNRDESKMEIEVRQYSSEQSYSEGEAPERELHVVNQIDFNNWFNFDNINSGDSIVRRIFAYIVQLPGQYPGTMMFEDWMPDLS